MESRVSITGKTSSSITRSKFLGEQITDMLHDDDDALVAGIEALKVDVKHPHNVVAPPRGHLSQLGLGSINAARENLG